MKTIMEKSELFLGIFLIRYFKVFYLASGQPYSSEKTNHFPTQMLTWKNWIISLIQ